MALEDLIPEVREEEILNGSDIEPATRLEYFMKKAANEVPKPASGDAGKIVAVNDDSNGYELLPNTGRVKIFPLKIQGVGGSPSTKHSQKLVFTAEPDIDAITEWIDSGGMAILQPALGTYINLYVIDYAHIPSAIFLTASFTKIYDVDNDVSDINSFKISCITVNYDSSRTEKWVGYSYNMNVSATGL